MKYEQSRTILLAQSTGESTVMYSREKKGSGKSLNNNLSQDQQLLSESMSEISGGN